MEQSDRNLAVAMDYALGAENWVDLLKTLESMLTTDNQNATVTWGEFLLCFIDGGVEELATYQRFANIGSDNFDSAQYASNTVR